MNNKLKRNTKTNDINEIETDYAINDTDSDEMYILKDYILNRLPTAEKNILLLYLEYGSYAEVAKRLNCSTPTASKYIKMIINKIRENVNVTKPILDCPD